ncbi:MAG: SGNH/GDSL hydrolase family protein [Alphaproteobacteria bacterium]|nr:SGNH/GDSL hydrolase family protein [Alphaproteobacteria bacterium]
MSWLDSLRVTAYSVVVMAALAPVTLAQAQSVGTSRSGQSLGDNGMEHVTRVVKPAGNVMAHARCEAAGPGEPKAVGALPHISAKLTAGKPVVIVAFGSSSTQGYGASKPEFNYPNRLAAQLRKHYPASEITVLNAGVGGEDAPEMMKRLQSSVLDPHPDLVIWQVGTNAVLRNLDPTDTVHLVEQGVVRIQAAGSDIVLVDPQYSPRINERAPLASTMVRQLGRVAALHHVAVFSRFAVMRDWHEKLSIPVEDFVIGDGLHMNDWGYGCFAQLLANDIILSVDQIRYGGDVHGGVRRYRPL